MIFTPLHLYEEIYTSTRGLTPVHPSIYIIIIIIIIIINNILWSVILYLMAKQSADENFEMIMASPVLSRLARDGVRSLATSSLVSVVRSLYEQVVSYPAGYLWIGVYDESHCDEFTLPDYDISSRRDGRRLMRLFDKHLLKRKRLLEGLLVNLQRGEPLPKQQDGYQKPGRPAREGRVMNYEQRYTG